MRVIQHRNVNNIFPVAVAALRRYGKEQPSRNGATIEFPTPVTTVYENPRERVLFDPVRDANPVLHLMDALYCLAGRSDVYWIDQFSSRMKTFSDDGITFNGAYGYRWRYAYGFDQLERIVGLFQQDPDSRRAVLSMWDNQDLNLSMPGGRMSKDVPCNTSIYFKLRDGLLNMTVNNRSNDMIWGAYGANVVQFSILQEYLAAMIGCDIGVYYQCSDSLHAYTDVFEKVKHRTVADDNPYETGEVRPFPLVHDAASFDEELEMFMKNVDSNEWANRFFDLVAIPMRDTWFAWKRKNYRLAYATAQRIEASDWRKATLEWLARRGVSPMIP